MSLRDTVYDSMKETLTDIPPKQGAPEATNTIALSPMMVHYGLQVICPCNYTSVITAVITCNYSPPF